MARAQVLDFARISFLNPVSKYDEVTARTVEADEPRSRLDNALYNRDTNNTRI